MEKGYNMKTPLNICGKEMFFRIRLIGILVQVENILKGNKMEKQKQFYILAQWNENRTVIGFRKQNNKKDSKQITLIETERPSQLLKSNSKALGAIGLKYYDNENVEYFYSVK